MRFGRTGFAWDLQVQGSRRGVENRAVSLQEDGIQVVVDGETLFAAARDHDFSRI